MAIFKLADHGQCLSFITEGEHGRTVQNVITVAHYVGHSCIVIKLARNAFLSFLMQHHGNRWTVIMHDTIVICASCQSLTTLAGKANWRKLHFFQ